MVTTWKGQSQGEEKKRVDTVHLSNKSSHTTKLSDLTVLFKNFKDISGGFWCLTAWLFRGHLLKLLKIKIYFKVLLRYTRNKCSSVITFKADNHRNEVIKYSHLPAMGGLKMYTFFGCEHKISLTQICTNVCTNGLYRLQSLPKVYLKLKAGQYGLKSKFWYNMKHLQ